MKKLLNVVLTIAIIVYYFIPSFEVHADGCNGYQLAAVGSDGNVTNLQCYANYSDAKPAMLNYNSTSTSVAVLYYNGKIVSAKYGIAKIIPKTSRDTINIYTDSTGGVKYTYMDTLSASDAAFIDYDASTNMAKIRISGYSGWTESSNIDIIPISTLNSNSIQITATVSLRVRTSASTSANVLGYLYNGNITKYYDKTTAEGYTWYKVIYNGQTGWVASAGDDWIHEINNAVSIQTYYEPYEPTGNLIHYFEYQNSGPAVSYTNLGTKPGFLQYGVRYYSFDGNYFYTNILDMLDDYRNNSSSKSLNKDNPYYSYYLYLPTRSKTGYTADDFNQYIKNNGYTRNIDSSVNYVTYNDVTKTLSWVDGVSRSGISLMYNEGQDFVDAANTYGINALMMFNTAVNESDTGTSALAFYKKNIFGLGAADSDPVNLARSYSTIKDSIIDFAKFTGSSNSNYTNPNKIYYYGSNYGNKGSGMNVNYAADPYWGEKQATNSFNNDRDFGLQDFNSNTIGIKTAGIDVPIRKGPSNSSSVIYYLKNNYYNRNINNIPVIVSDKVYTVEDGVKTGWYKVYTDTALNSSQDMDGTVDYNFSNSYGYIREDYLYVANNQPMISAQDIVSKQGVNVNLLDGVTAADTENGNLTGKVQVSGNYDINTIGAYNITYTVEDNSRFSTSKTVQLNVVPTDQPVIVAYSHEVSMGTTFDPKIGITAYDQNGNDLTSSITVTQNNVDTNTLGTYHVTYSVTDSQNKTVTKTIDINVTENQKPVITATDRVIPINSSFDPKLGVSATDNEDGNLNSSIIVTSNNVNTAVPGDYSVTYQVTDSVSNVTSKTIKVTVEDRVYTDKVGDFYFNKMEWSNNRLNIEGSLAITGMDNLSSTNITYDLILSDNINGGEYILPLDRWLGDHPSRAYIDNKYNYGDSWFKGSIDLSNVPQGEYTMYIRARSGNVQSRNLFRNMMGKSMVRKATDSNNRGYLFRNNNYKNTYPIELFIRDSGLISTVDPPHQSNMYNTYDSVGIDNGYLNIVGKSYNINGDYSSSANVERYLIFENTSTFTRYQFNIGSYAGDNIPLRVDDGKSKVRGWFNTSNKINLETLPEGNYAIYIRTRSGSVDDYGELNDVFMKNISDPTKSTVLKTTYYNSRTYTVSLNKNARFRLELNIRK